MMLRTRVLEFYMQLGPNAHLDYTKSLNTMLCCFFLQTIATFLFFILKISFFVEKIFFPVEKIFFSVFFLKKSSSFEKSV